MYTVQYTVYIALYKVYFEVYLYYVVSCINGCWSVVDGFSSPSGSGKGWHASLDVETCQVRFVPVCFVVVVAILFVGAVYLSLPLHRSVFFLPCMMRWRETIYYKLVTLSWNLCFYSEFCPNNVRSFAESPPLKSPPLQTLSITTPSCKARTTLQTRCACPSRRDRYRLG